MNYTMFSSASRYRRPRNVSRYDEPRHERSTMFRLGNNGDVLVLYSKSIDDPQTGRAIYPIRYYLIRHEWSFGMNGSSGPKAVPIDEEPVDER